MAYEDRTLACVECGAEFTFSAGEQEFFEQRGLNSPPKRCAACRKAQKQRGRKSRTQGGGGEYRSPSFQGSAPEHQGGRGGRRRGSGPAPRKSADYRSPAFRGQAVDHEADYRAPAFHGIDTVDPEDEYRAPGFREGDGAKPDEEYRAPGFAEYATRWRDERPMFSITCAVCGEKSMVPFLPEEKERALCPACHKAERDAARAAEAAHPGPSTPDGDPAPAEGGPAGGDDPDGTT